MKVSEALTPEDQREILGIEGNILDLKRDLIDAEGDSKENIKSRIDDLKQRISDIKDRAKDEEFVTYSYKKFHNSDPNPIFKNPTVREMKDLPIDFRALFDPRSKDVYVSSTDVLHDQMMKALRELSGIRLDDEEVIYIVTDFSKKEVHVDDYDRGVDFSEFYKSPFFQKFLEDDYTVVQNGERL